MRPIGAMSRARARQIVERVKGEITPMLDDEHLEIITHRATITPHGGITIKIEFGAIDADGASITQRAEFARLAALFNLQPDDYGRMITLRGDSYLIVGINPRSHKYPIELKRVRDGVPYRYSRDAVIAAIGPRESSNEGPESIKKVLRFHPHA